MQDPAPQNDGEHQRLAAQTGDTTARGPGWPVGIDFASQDGMPLAAMERPN